MSIRFYLILIGINIACFLPFYFINYRKHPNPVEFLTANWRSPWQLFKKLYVKYPLSDPFRVNFDYTFLILIVSALQFSPTWITLLAALVWTFGFLDFSYSAVMVLIFRRRPSLRSDLMFARSGLSVIHDYRRLFVIGIIVIVLLLVLMSALTTAYLLQQSPPNRTVNLVLAFGLLLPAFYNWRAMRFPVFLFRTVYSPSLNFYRNYRFSQAYESIHALDSSDFESLNDFTGVWLRSKPNFVTVCVESYGSFAHLDDATYAGVRDVLETYVNKFADAGLKVASTFSEPPLFAGGSWLSYTSFTYGLKIDNHTLHYALFDQNDSFGAYESLFHVLKRNGYQSFLLCPLGGYEASAVNWDSINRCFFSDKNYDFESLKYHGRTYPFMSRQIAYFPADQYSLNFAYSAASAEGSSPFSLFFCTLNSHYPWDSPSRSIAAWRELQANDHGPIVSDDQAANLADKYRAAIRYQLDYLLRFTLDHADENLIVVLFGDHQAPFVTPEQFGKKTPVHVISHSGVVIQALCENGFVEGLDLSKYHGDGIRHEGFLSLFMRAVNKAFGQTPDTHIELREGGANLHGLLSGKGRE